VRVSKRSHKLDSVQLAVEILSARPPPPLILADVDGEKLVFSDLPVSQYPQRTTGKAAAAAAATDASGDDTDDDGNDEQKLKEFVQSAAGAQIGHVTYSTQRDKAVVSFLSTPG